MKFLLCLLILLPQLAQAQADWRVNLRFGQQYYQDEGRGLITDARGHAALEFGVDSLTLQLSPRNTLGVGAAFHLTGANGIVYDEVGTDLLVWSLRTHALYRLLATDTLAFVARVGPAYRSTRVSLSHDGRRLEAKARDWGLQAALGVDAVADGASPGEGEGPVLGVSLVATYTHFDDVTLTPGSTSLGGFNASGLGWLAGLTILW